MNAVRGMLVAGLIALGGAGGAVFALNLDTTSPRRLAAGVIAAVIGIGGGGILLARFGAGSKRRGA
jgi:hypothetical protein